MTPFKILRMRKTTGGGGAGGSISITDQYVDHEGAGAGGDTVSYRLHYDGKVYKGLTMPNGSMNYSTIIETWLVSGTNANFQARATLISGEITSAIGTWQTLNAISEWFIQVPLGGAKSAILLVEIRDVATPFTVRDSATINLSVANGGE